jgi:hypothetical protein
MMGPWKVNSQFFGGARMSIVCRQADVDKPEHSGNLIYADRGYTTDELISERYAAELNAIETALPVCRKCGRAGKIRYFSESLVSIQCERDKGERICSEAMAPTLREAVKLWCELNHANEKEIMINECKEMVKSDQSEKY